MSAWKPSVLGRFDELRAARPLRFQLCMPPQQISPSAARRSPYSSATSHASPERVGDRLLVARRDRPPSRSGSPAESMRTTPYGRMPSSRSVLAMRQRLAHLRDEVACARRRSPIAEPPPVGGQTGATTEPTTRLRDADLSASRFRSFVGRVDADVRIEEKQVDAVELHAVDVGGGGQIEHRVEVDRRLGIRRPCRRRRATWRYEVRGICALSVP